MADRPKECFMPLSPQDTFIQLHSDGTATATRAV